MSVGMRKIEKKIRKLYQLCITVLLGISKPEYGLNRGSRKIPVIVSLASHRPRFSTLHVSLKSLLCQTMKPDKIILNIAKEDENFIPKNVMDLCAYGITVRICEENLKPHNKYFYTMQEYPNALVITVDDDIVYNKTLVESLLISYQKHPDCIHAMRVHKMTKNMNGVLNPYNDWKFEYPDLQDIPSYALFATGVGGILYPPGCLNQEVFNAKNIKKLCLNADDIWLKFMELKNGTKCVCASSKNNRPYGFEIRAQRNNGLKFENWHKSKNDKYIVTLEKVFGIQLSEYSD